MPWATPPPSCAGGADCGRRAPGPAASIPAARARAPAHVLGLLLALQLAHRRRRAPDPRLPSRTGIGLRARRFERPTGQPQAPAPALTARGGGLLQRELPPLPARPARLEPRARAVRALRSGPGGGGGARWGYGPDRGAGPGTGFFAGQKGSPPVVWDKYGVVARRYGVARAGSLRLPQVSLARRGRQAAACGPARPGPWRSRSGVGSPRARRRRPVERRPGPLPGGSGSASLFAGAGEESSDDTPSRSVRRGQRGAAGDRRAGQAVRAGLQQRAPGPAVARIMRVADLFRVPVLLTEQYPRGLGRTAPAIAAIYDAPPRRSGCCWRRPRSAAAGRPASTRGWGRSRPRCARAAAAIPDDRWT